MWLPMGVGESGGAAEQGHGKVERGHRWGSAKAEQGHRWSHQKKVGGDTPGRLR